MQSKVGLRRLRQSPHTRALPPAASSWHRAEPLAGTTVTTTTIRIAGLLPLKWPSKSILSLLIHCLATRRLRIEARSLIVSSRHGLNTINYGLRRRSEGRLGCIVEGEQNSIIGHPRISLMSWPGSTGPPLDPFMEALANHISKHPCVVVAP